jgi:hypothetical protein
MLINRDHGRSAQTNQSGIKLFMPLIIVALTAYFVPLLAPVFMTGTLTVKLASTQNSQITSLCAAVAALLLFRRVTLYPGTRAFGYILPSFSTTFGVAVTLLLVLRINYSGSMLITSYLATVGATFLLGYFDQRGAPTRMYYVPTGNTGIVGDTPPVEWIRMTDPFFLRILVRPSSRTSGHTISRNGSGCWPRRLWLAYRSITPSNCANCSPVASRSSICRKTVSARWCSRLGIEVSNAPSTSRPVSLSCP